MSKQCFVIAVDGPAGAGKSSTSKRVARRLGYVYVDSGALYRCVALAALESGTPLDDEEALGRLIAGLEVETFCEGTRFRLNNHDVSEAIRSQKVSDAASRTSACSVVRQALLQWQRDAVAPPGAVVEGRDIGTVVFPDADLKIFLCADAKERARRRAAEQQSGAAPGGAEQVLGRGAGPASEHSAEAHVAGVERDIAERDCRDSSRKLAPLKAASDAVVIDSTDIDLETVVERVLAEVERVRSRN